MVLQRTSTAHSIQETVVKLPIKTAKEADQAAALLLQEEEAAAEAAQHAQQQAAAARKDKKARQKQRKQVGPCVELGAHASCLVHICIHVYHIYMNACLHDVGSTAVTMQVSVSVSCRTVLSMLRCAGTRCECCKPATPDRWDEWRQDRRPWQTAGC